MGDNRIISQSTFGHDARIHQGDVIAYVKGSVSVINNYDISSPEATNKRDGEEDILRRLYTTPYEDRKDRNPPRVPGTCEWFISHELFKEWERSKSSRMLWVSADPGCGKSVLVKHLVDSILQTTESRTVCYFFFKDDFSDQRNVVSALRCILRQLFLKKPLLLSDQVLRQFVTGGKTFVSSFSELWKTLVQVSKDPNAGEVICILDAIDECEDQGSQLAQELCKLYGAANDFHLKFLLTSRPYGKIHRGFRPLEIPELPVIHLSGESDNEIEKISQEIDIFIHYKVKDIGKRLKLLEEEQSLLLQELMDISNRTYIWVYLTFDVIERDIVVDKTISDAASRIPETVDEAYDRILSKSCDFEQAKKILHIVMAATRPLTVEEMNLALALQKSHQSHHDIKLKSEERFRQELRDICGLFITIINSKIYLLHQTAREFLLDNNPKSPTDVYGDSTWKHSLNMFESHNILFDICISYLCNLGSDANCHDETGALCLCAEDMIFLDYSAKYWVTHFFGLHTKTQNEKTELILKICDVDSRHCQTWFEAYWASTNSKFPKGFTSLMIAAYFGLQTAVQSLIEADVDLDLQDDTYQRTALSWAVRNGFKVIAELLVKGVRFKQGPFKLPWRKKAKVDQVDIYGRTPLFYAVWNGSAATVKLLINAGARVHLKDQLDGTPISYAVCNQNEQVVNILLRTGDASEFRSDINDLLFSAAERGHEEVIELLLKTPSANLDAKNVDEQTPLLLAMKYSHEEIARKLVLRGADPNCTDGLGRSPLIYAAKNGDLEMVKILLERGADPNHEDRLGRSPLTYAAKNGDVAIIKILLERGADPNYEDSLGWTLLTYAAGNGDVAMVKTLLEGGADPNCRSKYGETTLLAYAAMNGDIVILKALLEKEANPNCRSKYGRTPLTYAAMNGNMEILKILLEKGADPNEKDIYNETALSYAVKYNYKAAVKDLLKGGADLKTPLLWAVEKDREALVQTLMKVLEKADLEALALWAIEKGHEALVKLLLQEGIEVQAF